MKNRSWNPFINRAARTAPKTNYLILLVEMRGLEPLTSCMRSINPELPNLLNLLEAVDITENHFGKVFPILAGFSTLWNNFLTQIHTQPIIFMSWCVGGGERNYSLLKRPLSTKTGPTLVHTGPFLRTI
jgi:hypothetical protein